MKSFAFHRSYYETFEMLNDEQTVRLLEAMMVYAFEDQDTEFDDPFLKIAWANIKPNVEASAANSYNGSKGAKKTPKKPPKKGDKGAATEGSTETNRTERSGVENTSLPYGREEKYSTAPAVGAAVAGATPPPVLDGWDRTGVSCGYHRGTPNYRSPDGEAVCPKCHPELFPPDLLSRINAEEVAS